MKSLVTVKSHAAAWLQPNVDTDTLAPMPRLLKYRENLPYYCFEPFKFKDGTADSGELNPDFPLNQEYYKNCEIMMVGSNFGCGSSREPAAINIASLGIRVLIGISFGGIFFKNCYQQGILPIALPSETIERMAAMSHEGDFTVDLPSQTITCPDGTQIPFEIEQVKKECLLEGMTDIDYVMKRADKIASFMQQDKLTRTWLYQG